ncbi:MAG: hypothetical protein HY735_37795 [Verrucomicrobia bacterium]|nr:hypothetical protein [Verrucomicrobiota bacterium]
MKHITSILVFVSLLALSTLSVRPDDLSKLEGKWAVKKTNDEGQSYTQSLEIKKDKFKFTIKGGNDQVFLYAEGGIKLTKLGPFNAVKFFAIKAGSSADQTESIDDDREMIYTLDDNRWALATNFDKQRDNEKPTVDIYARENK